MPYLNCPSCRLTLYSEPDASPPERCTRCGARLGGPARSLFKTARPGGMSGSRVVEALRDRRTARDTRLEKPKLRT
jgi:hypothetical protein